MPKPSRTTASAPGASLDSDSSAFSILWPAETTVLYWTRS
jgi:hypothetical protein